MYKFLNKEYEILPAPLTKKQITAIEGKVSAVIEVGLSDMINRDLEGFLDFLEESLVEEGLVMEIDYELVGCTNDNIVLLLVSGHIDIEPDDEC